MNMTFGEGIEKLATAYLAIKRPAEKNQALELEITNANDLFWQLIEAFGQEKIRVEKGNLADFQPVLASKISRLLQYMQPVKAHTMEVYLNEDRYRAYVVLLKNDLAAAVIMGKDERQQEEAKTESPPVQSFYIQIDAVHALSQRQLKNSLYTSEHADRMKEMSQRFARYAGMSEEEIHNLVVLSQLHDIGKLYISNEIIDKPGRLTPAERREIENHSLYGFILANQTPNLTKIAHLILTHHERWDGKGYPVGLAEEEIPLLSRALAILDAYDAMVNDRPYRKAMDKQSALKEIRANLGSQFDPRVGRTFIEFVEKIS